MQRNAWKLAVGTAAVAAALMYLGASGEARQAPQTGGGGRGGARGAAPAPAAADAELHTLHVQGNVYMLVGAGGNIAVQIGDDGVLLVDTGLAANADKVVAAVRTLSNKPIRYIVNTHVHPDHVGGNDAIGKLGSTIAGGNVGAGAGVGAEIIAHENVLNRMSAPTGQQAPFPTTAWPTDTYISKQKELFFNGESLQIIHRRAHTDGEASSTSGNRCDRAGDLFDDDAPVHRSHRRQHHRHRGAQQHADIASRRPCRRADVHHSWPRAPTDEPICSNTATWSRSSATAPGRRSAAH